MKKILINFFVLFSFITTSFSQECVEFEYESLLSGYDFINFSFNPTFKVCEEDKEINIGSETFYYTRGIKNHYGDFYYAIQEARGYGWPEIGYVKIGASMNVVEIKFMNTTAKFSIISPEVRKKRQAIEELNRLLQEEKRKETEKRKFHEDSLKYPEINALINQKKFFEAENKLKTLFFPNSFEKSKLIYEEVRLIKLQNERKVVIAIEASLNEKNTEIAIQKYNGLVLLKDSVKKQLTLRFIQQFHDSLVEGKKENLTAFIENATNKNILSKKEDGKYEIIIGQNGEKENGNENKLVLSSLTNSTIEYFSFIVPIKTKYSFTINTNKQLKVHTDSIRYIFSEKFKRKTLYVSKKGDYYFNKFGAPLNAKMLNRPQYIDEEIKKYDINVEQLIRYSKVVNGIEITSYKQWEQEKVIKAKKGTGRKIIRIILSPIWGPFYLLSLS